HSGHPYRHGRKCSPSWQSSPPSWALFTGSFFRSLEDEMKAKASVKVMRSFDYCHFEVALATDQYLDSGEVNSLRIEAAKLADHAVNQYRAKQQAEGYSASNSYKREELERKVKAIKENFPQSEWTPEQKATVKQLDDLNFSDRFEYDEDYE